MNDAFSIRYRAVAERLPFSADFEERVLKRAMAGEKPRPLSPLARIPAKARRAAGIAALAACLVLAVLCLVPLFRGGTVKLPHSTGSVSVRVVGDPDLPGRAPMTWETAEEQALFDGADAVFSGRVQKLETLELEVGGELSYRSRAAVLVDRAWKGEAHAGETVSILLPYAVHGESGETEIINRLAEGTKALFLAQTYTEEDVLSNDKGTLALMDLAAYGLRDDRHLILRGENGEAVCCPGTYPSLPEGAAYAQAEALADRLTGPKLTVATISTSASATATSTNTLTGTTTTGGAKTTQSKTTAATTPTTAAPIMERAENYYYGEIASGGLLGEPLYRIAEDGSMIRLPIENSLHSFWTDGAWLFSHECDSSSAEKSGIFRYKADGTGQQKIFDGYTMAYTFNKNSILFSSQPDYARGDYASSWDQSLYSMDKDGNNRKEVYRCEKTQKIVRLAADENNAYAIVASPMCTKIIQISLSNGSAKTIYTTDASSEFVICTSVATDKLLVDNGWLYFFECLPVDSPDYPMNPMRRLVRMRTDGTGKTMLVKDVFRGTTPEFYGGRVYFIYSDGTNEGLFSLSLDNLAEKPAYFPLKFPSGKTCSLSGFQFCGDYLYYQYSIKEKDAYGVLLTNGSGIGRVRPDGSKAQLFESQ